MSRFVLTMLVAATLAASMISAETIIPGGNVSGVWNAVGSPYLIQGNITIPANEILIVQPGVYVRFDGVYSWTVQGCLQAMGTVNDSIIMTPNDTTTGWRGLKFDHAQTSCSLRYCLIEYATSLPYDTGGGAVSSQYCDPFISHCTFRYNTNDLGAGIQCLQSDAIITFSDFCNNSASWGGGAIAVVYRGWPVIANNTFRQNVSAFRGGAIEIDVACQPQIVDNCFIGNVGYQGGGVNTLGDNYQLIIVHGNVFADNIVMGPSWPPPRGAGILAQYMDIANNIFYHNINLAGSGGGIFHYFWVNVRNAILFLNDPDQISPSYEGIRVNYCSVQHGWPGIGNINSDPLFVAPQYYDFRLQWGSPCIDAGDPDPLNNDPDGTRGDMGAFYYDQSVPVRVLLTPHERSIVIPPQGGHFDYTLWLSNIDPSNPQFTLWMDITRPDGTTFGPVLGPLTAQLDSGVTISRVRSQMIPARALKGLYSYNAYAVVAADTSRDSFSFFKMAPAQAGGMLHWETAGQSLEDLRDMHLAFPLPLNFSLQQSYPNPFNPQTTINYQLSANSHVSLKVYDVAGKCVATLVNGWRETGSHQVTWDASGLPSGLYFCRMQAADFSAVRKMMLLK